VALLRRNIEIPQRKRTTVSRHGIIYFFSFLFFFSTDDSRHVRTRVAFVTNFFRASAKRKTVRRITANSYSPRSVSGRINGMMPAGVRILYAPVRRRIDESSPLWSVPLITPLCERLIAVWPRLYDRDLSHLPSRNFSCHGNRLARTKYKSELLSSGVEACSFKTTNEGQASKRFIIILIPKRITLSRIFKEFAMNRVSSLSILICFQQANDFEDSSAFRV